jgi:hypothetical protein
MLESFAFGRLRTCDQGCGKFLTQKGELRPVCCCGSTSPSSIPPFERYKNADGMAALQSNPTSP